MRTRLRFVSKVTNVEGRQWESKREVVLRMQLDE